MVVLILGILAFGILAHWIFWGETIENTLGVQIFSTIQYFSKNCDTLF